MVSNNTNNTGELSEYYVRMFDTISLFVVVFLSLLSVSTVLSNGFALFVIYRDPLKYFRTPLSIFITGILISDFLIGLFVEPVFAFLWRPINFGEDDESFMKIIRVSQILSTVTINTSFLTLLALAVAQLIGLASPGVYVRSVSRTSAMIGIVVIWLYTIMFALVPEMFGMYLDKDLDAYQTYFIVDLILHTTLITVALVVIYAVAYFAFKRAMVRYEASLEAQRDREDPSDPDSHPVPKEEVEKEFIKGTFILIMVLIITVWPFAITLYIWSFQKYPVDFSVLVGEYIAFVVFECFLFLKFLLDPFIFLWRLPKYRKAWVMVYQEILKSCGCAPALLPNAEYHHAEQAASSEGDLHDVDVEFLEETTNPSLEFHVNETVEA